MTLLDDTIRWSFSYDTIRRALFLWHYQASPFPMTLSGEPFSYDTIRRALLIWRYQATPSSMTLSGEAFSYDTIRRALPVFSAQHTWIFGAQFLYLVSLSTVPRSAGYPVRQQLFIWMLRCRTRSTLCEFRFFPSAPSRVFHDEDVVRISRQDGIRASDCFPVTRHLSLGCLRARGCESLLGPRGGAAGRYMRRFPALLITLRQRDGREGGQVLREGSAYGRQRRRLLPQISRADFHTSTERDGGRRGGERFVLTRKV